MILDFNSTLFNSNDTEILQVLSALLRELLEDAFLMKGIPLNLEMTQLYKQHLSLHEQENIKEYLQKIAQQTAYLTQLHEKYLTTIRVGLGKGEIPPQTALKIVKTEARIILENATSDWKFIKGIVTKYEKHKERKTIYKIIAKAIIAGKLVPENAGGKGGIKTRINELSNDRYSDISSYKLMTLFDSDSQKTDELKEEQKKLIQFLKNNDKINTVSQAIYDSSDIIIWHILYKREIENYVPLSVLKYMLNIENQLDSLSDTDYDFSDFEELLPNIAVKSELPKLFLADWTRDKLEERVKHHLVKVELPNGTLQDVSEIEQILLKIARII